MFSPLKRLILITFLMKKYSKFSALLSIIVISFCLIIISTILFTFYTYSDNYKPVKAINIRSFQPRNNLENSFLLYNYSESDSIQRQFLIEANLKTHSNSSSLMFNSSGLKQSFNDWSERPWFLMNGSLRLNPLEASKLALWPEESIDPSDDRIVNQLMFVPVNYNQTKAPLKSIYLSTRDDDWRLSFGRREFLNCPVSSCRLVRRARAKSADLIFFKSGFEFKHFIKKRKPNQIWAKFEIESPQNALIAVPEDSINWTVTYRHDSEISVPYYKFYPFEKSVITKNVRNYAAKKTRKVAWFVSNCLATNVRLEYAQELAKYIQVDIYGRCGNFECPKTDNSSQCWDLLNNDYKFYLSFENSNCLDYITEKFWLNGLKQNILPIVMGAHPSTYRRVAPPNSYIHVDDFQSAKHLAEYLNLLDTNDELYNKYFEWKGRGQIKQIYMWCRLCAMLHSPPRHRFYHQLSKWWAPDNSCVPITWTNMKLETNPVW